MILAVDAHNLRAGGGVTHLVSLLQHADPAAHFSEVHVFTGRAGQQRLATGLPASVRIVHEPQLDSGLASRTWWHRTVLRKRLESLRANVLFSPGGLLPPSWPRATAAVTMCRNMLPFQAEEAARYGLSGRRLRLVLLRREQIRSFRRADGVIFLSEFVRQLIQPQTGPLQRTAVIPHGVNQEFADLPKSAAPGSEILYVSTIDLYKHQWHVVHAARMLRDRGHDVRLTLAGGAYPPALARLRHAIQQHGMEEHVSYLGEVPHHALPGLYERATAAVFASSCENCPNALLEGMATATPIACSDRPPMPEFASDAVLYCDPERPSTIAHALERILADPAAARQLGQRAAVISRAFRWENAAAATMAFLGATACR